MIIKSKGNIFFIDSILRKEHGSAGGQGGPD
jgi:hypothetical protein